jgi:hypothetical protein
MELKKIIQQYRLILTQKLMWGQERRGFVEVVMILLMGMLGGVQSEPGSGAGAPRVACASGGGGVDRGMGATDANTSVAVAPLPRSARWWLSCFVTLGPKPMDCCVKHGRCACGPIIKRWRPFGSDWNAG